MAIREFGESLLQDARKRSDRADKADRKREKRADLIKFGVEGAKALINSSLSKRWNNFSQNEELLGAKVKYKNAVEVGTSFLETQTAINQSGLGASEWYYKQMEDVFRQNALEHLPLEISGNERLFDASIRTKLMPEAVAKALEHKKGLALAQNLDTFENYTKDVARQVKMERPKDIAGAAISAAKRLFAGQTRAEQDQAALTAITTGPMSKSADAMITFNKRYKETNNVLAAYNYANIMDNEDIQNTIDEEKDITKETTVTHDIVGNQVLRFISIKTTNTITKESDTTQSVEVVTGFNDPKDKEARAQDMVRISGLSQLPRNTLTPAAHSSFVEEVADAGLNPFDIRSPEDYAKVADIYANYVAHKPNLKDKFRDDIFVSVVASLNTGNLKLNNLYLSLESQEPGSTAYIKILDVIKTEKKIWQITALTLANHAVEVARGGDNTTPNRNTTIKNKHNFSIDMWDKMTDEHKRNVNSYTRDELVNKGIL